MESETTHAIDVIRQGNLVEGAKILSQVLNVNPEDEQAWLWMSACVSDKDKKVYCLEKVIQINPSNQSARKGLVSMGVEVAPEVIQPAHPDEGSGFSYRDLTAAFGGHGPAASEPAPAAVGPVSDKGGGFADMVKQMQSKAEQAAPESQSYQPVSSGEPVAQGQRSSASADRAMMLEDFGYVAPEIEPDMAAQPIVLEPVEHMQRPSRKRRGKNNWLLGIIILLLVLLLIFVLVAKFVIKVI